MSREIDLIAYTEKLAMFIRRGVPVDRIIENTAKDIKDRQLRESFHRVSKEITSGKTFSQSLKSIDNIYSKSLFRLVEAGEERGELADTLEDVAGYLRDKESFKEIIKNLLIGYLLFADILAIIIIIGFVFITPLYFLDIVNMQLTLPLFTQIIIYITEFFLNPINKMIFIFLLVFLNLFIYLYDPMKSRFFYDFIITRSSVRKYYLFLTSSLTVLLIKRGIPLQRAFIEISKEKDFRLLNKSLFAIVEELQSGFKSLTIPGTIDEFSDIINRLEKKGEKTGKLKDYLEVISNSYTKDLLCLKKHSIKAGNGVIFLALALIFFAVALLLFDPLVSLLTFPGKIH